MTPGLNPRSRMPSMTLRTSSDALSASSRDMTPPSLVSTMCQEWSAMTTSPSAEAAMAM